MKKKVIKVGNSLGIVIDRPIVELAGIRAGSVVIMELVDGELVIRVRKKGQR